MSYKTHPKERLAHRNAIRRCTNPKDKSYKNYGARGIKFNYASFAEFLADVGPCPDPKLTLERLDTNGHYEAGNCIWASRSVQSANRRPYGKHSQFKGVFKTGSGKYHAQIRYAGKRICMPVVSTELQAAQDYDVFILTHGLERSLNFPLVELQEAA